MRVADFADAIRANATPSVIQRGVVNKSVFRSEFRTKEQGRLENQS